jgi:hypothetical protein
VRRPILPEVSAARLLDVARVASPRVLADLRETGGDDSDGGESARRRLEAALGRDFAERLVEALSVEALDRLEAALSPAFAARLAAAVAAERGEAV